MPKNHRASRHVQLRRLNCHYRQAPANGDQLLGVSAFPIVQQDTGPHRFGITLVPGKWTLPKFDQTPEIQGISPDPIEWKLIPLDQ